MAFLISQNHDGPMTFYAPNAGRAVAGGGGWTAKDADALGFARRVDAQTYLDFHLAHVAPMCDIVERDVA